MFHRPPGLYKVNSYLQSLLLFPLISPPEIVGVAEAIKNVLDEFGVGGQEPEPADDRREGHRVALQVLGEVVPPGGLCRVAQ